MQKLRRTTQPRRGAAMVEMALVLPVFIMVTLGIVEFGRAMMVSQLITSAAYQGARLAIIDGNSNAKVRSAVEEFMVNAVGVSASDVAITITVDPAQGNPDTGDEVANAQPRDLITVRAQVPYDSVNFIPGKWMAGKSLLGTSAMRHE